MLEGLRQALDQTGFEWAFGGWSEAPMKDYGVYSLSGQVQFRVDEDSGAEIMLRGYIDYFTHDFSRDPQKAIENVLRGLRLWWNLESIQFEPETGFIHYEWSWSDPEGATELPKIRFVMHDKAVELYVQPGETPKEPARDGYTDENGLFYVRTQWDAPIVPAVGDTTYTAEYHLFGYHGAYNRVYNGKAPNENGLPMQTQRFTQTQVEVIRQKKYREGEQAKAVRTSDMTSYTSIGGLNIRATGNEGTIMYPPSTEIYDVTFMV